MMKRILASLSIPLLLVVLLIPVYSEAAYRIILQNGSSIDGVRSYSESGDDINLFFAAGSMTILKKDVLRIEGTEEALPEDDQQEEQPAQATQPAQEKGSAEPVTSERGDSKQVRLTNLNNGLNSINAELKTVQERESSLVKEINEKSGKKFFNVIQLRQIEKEVAPLKKELAEVQQKKEQLIQKRSAIADEIKGLR